MGIGEEKEADIGQFGFRSQPNQLGKYLESVKFNICRKYWQVWNIPFKKVWKRFCFDQKYWHMNYCFEQIWTRFVLIKKIEESLCFLKICENAFVLIKSFWEKPLCSLNFLKWNPESRKFFHEKSSNKQFLM